MKRWLVVALVAVLGIAAYGWMKRDLIIEKMESRKRQQNLFQAVSSASPEQLRTFLDQPDPELRRVAAVRLAQSNDPSGRAALVASLYPQTIFATGPGAFEPRVKLGAKVSSGQVIAVLGGQPLRSPIPGQLIRFYEPQPGGYQLGHRVAEILPAQAGVRESIAAIGQVGKLSDAEELESLARAFPQFTTDANAACQMIRARRK